MSTSASAAKNSVGVLVTRLLVAPLSFISSILIARMLGEKSLGYYGILQLYGGLWLPLASLGLGGSATYFLSSRKYKSEEVVMTVMIQGFVQGLFVMLFVCALKYFQLLGRAVDDIDWGTFLPIVAILPCQGIFGMGARIFWGDSLFKVSNFFYFVSTAIPLTFQIAIVFFHPDWIKNNPVNYEFERLKLILKAYVVSQIILAIFMLVTLFWKYRPTKIWNAQYMSQCWAYGIKVWSGDVTTQLNLRGDQQILSFFMTAETIGQMGLYKIAAMISEILWMIPDSFNMVLFNKIAASKNVEDRVTLVEQVHRILFWMMMVFIFLAALAGPVLLWVVRKEFIPAKWPFWLLLPGTLALTTTKVITKFLSGSGKPGLSSLTTLIGMTVGLLLCILTLILFPQWGISGMAVASSLGYFATAVISIYLFRKDIAPMKSRLFRFIPDDWKWFKGQMLSLRPKARNFDETI